MPSRRAPVNPAATTTSRSAAGAVSHGHQVLRGYEPDGTKRKERKVLDAGAAVEVKLNRLLNSPTVGVDSWRLPGIKTMRLSGIMYSPDSAGWVKELDGIVPDQFPEVRGRRTYNCLFEFKGQKTGGSAEKKIGPAIVDVAHHCDRRGVVGAVILDTPALTDRQIVAYKTLGRTNSVVVMTAAEVAAGLLVPELVRVAKERRRLALRINLHGKYVATVRPGPVERAFANRHTERISMRRAMGKYGRDGLLR